LTWEKYKDEFELEDSAYKITLVFSCLDCPYASTGCTPETCPFEFRYIGRWSLGEEEFEYIE